MSCAWTTFPFLTALEFERACRGLVDRVCTCTTGLEGGWSSIRLVTQNATSLKITRRVKIHDNSEIQSEDRQDAQALVRTDGRPTLHIEYEILLSSTYQVPVLYFTLHRDDQGPIGLDGVYQYLVPEPYRKQLKSVGVMGGISFGYHPESGAPAFFVHPCNTADAMGKIADARTVTPETYLLIWLGLVGQCVSLNVPHELVLPQDSARPS
ncbi:hypothetical protein VI817_006069 [Penicillium citrinum]|nr:hypothetical protein VI817_006069 [Penicillium citrinum]